MNGFILHSVKGFSLYAATISGIGALVYTSRQIMTKDDLNETKKEVVKRIDRLEKRIDDLGSTLEGRFDTLLRIIRPPK